MALVLRLTSRVNVSRSSDLPVPVSPESTMFCPARRHWLRNMSLSAKSGVSTYFLDSRAFLHLSVATPNAALTMPYMLSVSLQTSTRDITPSVVSVGSWCWLSCAKSMMMGSLPAGKLMKRVKPFSGDDVYWLTSSSIAVLTASTSCGKLFCDPGKLLSLPVLRYSSKER